MTAATATLADVRTVNVPLGFRAYDVLIGPGIVARAGALIGERLGPARSRVAWSL